MRKRLLKLALLAAVAVMAMSANAYAAPPAGSNGVIDLIRAGGSDTTYFAEQKIADLYNGSPGCDLNPANDGTPSANFRGCRTPQSAGVVETENYDHDNIANDFPIGSGSGISQLCSQGQANRPPVDFARSSRDAQPSDCQGLTFTAFALDGVGVETFRAVNISATQGSPAAGCLPGQAPGACTGTPVTNLTTQQIRDIWLNCAIKDWRQLTNGLVLTPAQLAAYDYTDPTNEPIFVWTAQSGSGTRNTFDQFLGGGVAVPSTACLLDPTNTSDPTYNPASSNVIFENNAQPIAARQQIKVGGNLVAPGGPGGASTTKVQSQSIFFISFGRFVTAKFDAASGALTQVDGISANPATFLNGTYPIVRNLWRVTPTSGGPLNQFLKGAVSDFNKWACAPSSQHGTNPLNGRNYFSEVSSAISSSGFVREPLQGNGTFCFTQAT